MASSTTPRPLKRPFRTPLGTSKRLSSSFKSPMRAAASPVPAAEMTEESLRAQIAELEKQNNDLDSQIAELKHRGLKEEELAIHIEKLHEYNEIKDVAQMVLGRIAVQRGVTTRSLYGEYDLDLDD